MPEIQREDFLEKGQKLDDILFEKGFELQEAVDGVLERSEVPLIQDSGAHSPDTNWEAHDVELSRTSHFQTGGYDIKVEQGYDGSEQKHGFATLEIKKEGSPDVLTLTIVHIGNRASLVELGEEAQVVVKMALNDEPVAEFDSDSSEPLNNEASLKEMKQKVSQFIRVLNNYQTDTYGSE